MALTGSQLMEVQMKCTILALTIAIAALSGTAFAINADTILLLPGRYRIVEITDQAITFVDAPTLKISESRDYPSSVGNISGRFYVMDTVKNPTAMNFQKSELVTGIREYDVQLFGNKQTGDFKVMDAKLKQVFTADGESSDSKQDFITKSPKQLFTNLSLFDRARMSGRWGRHTGDFRNYRNAYVLPCDDERYSCGGYPRSGMCR